MSVVGEIKYNTAVTPAEAFKKIKSNKDESLYWLINGVWYFRMGGTNGIGLSILNEKDNKLNLLNKLIEN